MLTHFFSCLRRGDFRYTTIPPRKGFSSKNVRASGGAIVGTQRCFSKHFLINFCSRLRRGDFRYTTMPCKHRFCMFSALLCTPPSASRRTIRFVLRCRMFCMLNDTLYSAVVRFLTKIFSRLRRGDLRYTTILFKAFSS